MTFRLTYTRDGNCCSDNKVASPKHPDELIKIVCSIIAVLNRTAHAKYLRKRKKREKSVARSHRCINDRHRVALPRRSGFENHKTIKDRIKSCHTRDCKATVVSTRATRAKSLSAIDGATSEIHRGSKIPWRRAPLARRIRRADSFTRARGITFARGICASSSASEIGLSPVSV